MTNQDNEIPESIGEVLANWDDLVETFGPEEATAELVRTLMNFPTERLIRNKIFVKHEKKKEILEDVIEVKKELDEVKFKALERESKEESWARRDWRDEPYLSDAQISKIITPTKHYAKKAWSNGVWNLEWGGPEEYGIMIKPEVIANTQNPNSDFVYYVVENLDLPFSPVWGSIEDFFFASP